MKKIISIASQKGGVGKTTTTLNLGYSLSRQGGGVLIVDADPQGSLGIASNLRKRTDLGLVDLLKGSCRPEDAIAVSRDGALSVVGMGVVQPTDLTMIDQEAASGRLGRLIESLAEGYHYTLIDAPSGVGSLVAALLRCSNSVLLPVQAQSLAVKTLPAFLRTFQWVRAEDNPTLQLAGVLITMFDDGSEAEVKVLEDSRRSFPDGALFATTIPRSPLFEQASVRALPLAMLTDGRPLARHYDHVALELMDREQQGAQDHGATAGLF